MENLTIKNLSLPDKEKIINFTYNFSGGRTYIIYSENSDILKLLSDFIFYCEDDLIGEINFYGIAVKDFDRYTYRRNIVSRIESGFEQPEYLTAREYLKLYEFKEHKIESLLEYFGFPYDKLDKKIEELSNAEKNILEISKPYIKGSQIILSNLFFDTLDIENKFEYFQKIKQLNKKLGITQIIFSSLNDWDDRENLMLRLNRE